MVSLYGSVDDLANIVCDLSRGRNQCIQQFSIVSYEENKATITGLVSASSIPLFSAVYKGDEILFWFDLILWDLDVLDCFNSLVIYRFAFVLVFRVSFKIWSHCFIFGIGVVIVSVMGLLCLGRFPLVICAKHSAEILQRVLLLRCLLRRVLWGFNRRAHYSPSRKNSVRPEGRFIGVRIAQSMFTICVQPQPATTVLILQLHMLKLSSSNLSLVFVFVVLDLIILGLVMKVKTTSIRSGFASSSAAIVTSSSTPSQPDPFRFRHLKTDSDFRGYSRHFGYNSRHFGYNSRHIGYVLATVTIS